jgi:hypothetical protein
MASDDRVRDVLLRLEPPVSGVSPDWDDVIKRARRMRSRRDGGRFLAQVRRVGLTRGLLLAATISAIGVGAAGAAHLFSSGGSLFQRHYPVGRHLAHVQYHHAAAPVRLQREVGIGTGWNLSRYQEQLRTGAGRYLASVTVARKTYQYFGWPMAERHGYCIFDANPRPGLAAEQQFCAYETPQPTPWVNRPPPFKYTIHRDIRPFGGIQSPLVAQVSDPISGYAQGFYPIGRPEAIFTVAGLIPSDAHGVEVRLQDGSSISASVNRPFFFAVVQGRQTRANHRPVAVAAIDPDGDELAVQTLYPAAFDPQQYALTQALGVVANITDDFISSNSTIKTDASAYTYHTDYLTTARRVARVFGGPPSRYPKVSVVVVFRGPITIAKRQRCVNGSVHCSLRRGHYGWVALIMPPAIRRLPDTFGSGSQEEGTYYPSNRRFNQLDREIRLLHLAPLHSTRLDLTPLGPWNRRSACSILSRMPCRRR